MAQLKLRPQPNVKRTALEDLRRVPLFASLPHHDGSLERLADLVWLREFQANEILMRYGEIQTSLLIFVEGKASAFRQIANDREHPNDPKIPSKFLSSFGDEQLVLVCEKGSNVLQSCAVYGETALIDALPSELRLKTETPGALWQLDAAAFEQFAHEFPRAAFAIQAAIARRLLRKTKEAQDLLLRLL